MLTQCDDEGKEFVMAYASRSNNVAQSCYSSYEEQCGLLHNLGVICLAQFTFVIDHHPLKWLMESDKLTGKLARWALIL